jgi:hypothetical protein
VRILTLLILKVSQFLLKYSQGTLTLAFNNSLAVDGTGAQLQRLLGVRGLAKYLKCYYLHVPISNISIHPLDPFQTPDQIEEYLVKLNQTFNFEPSGVRLDYSNEYSIASLAPVKLFAIVFRATFSSKNVLVRVLETYPVSDAQPKIIKNVIGDLKSFYSSEVYRGAPVFDLVMHYRQGVGGFVLYPGQRIPRQLPLEYFERILRETTLSKMEAEFNICILTDSPPEDLEFRPLPTQVRNWEGTPSFQDGTMKVKGMNFDALKDFPGTKLQVIVGGSPIEAISIMSKARNLVIGRSSLSYVSGILNTEGKVFCPKIFWHPPMKGWETRS